MQGDGSDALESLMQFLYRAPIGLVQSALDGSIEMLNPMTAQLLMPLVPDGALDNLYTALAAGVPQLRELVLALGDANGDVCEGLRFDCGAQVLSLSVTKLDATRLMATIADVTLEVRREQQGLDRRLRDATRTDALTQMPNRAALVERIQAALAAPAEPFALLVLNADRFSLVNDRLGPGGGDRLLMSMADRLRAALRSQDQPLAARIGGDEFAVLLCGVVRDHDAHSVVQRLLDALAEPYAIDGQRVHCSASVGLVLAGADAGDGAEALLHDATLAMVEAKRLGGNHHAVFEPTMRERAARRSGIEAELRGAIDGGQLFVVYQPVVGLAGGGAVDRSAGVEALVRWRHPERGIVPPLDFIPIAEECGLIGAIGQFVLETVCRDWALWQRMLGARAPRLAALNLSRAQLADDGFVDSVRRVLEAGAMPPAALQLEVTESLAAQDDRVQQRLHALKRLGVTLALDDFGTGYSSLASLHLLPVDTVKIDRSFVSQADTSAHHRVLIEATVRVAASLGMRTVAEGIETAAQAAVVAALGCDKGQGWLYSRPLPDDELVRWLRDGDAATRTAPAARTTTA